jgi:hypothetical protein
MDMKSLSATVKAVQALADEHAGGARGKTMNAVMSIFCHQDLWVDDDEDRSWLLTVIPDEDCNPYYWGVNA